MDELVARQIEERILINERLEKVENLVHDLDKIVVRGNGKQS